MSKSELDGLPVCWQYYADRSQQLQSARVDSIAYGREEQLGEVLSAIRQGDLFTPATLRRLDNVPRNRAKKYRRLDRVLRSRAPAESTPGPTTLEIAEEIGRVRDLLKPEEWDIEWSLANGASYADVASGIITSVAALKVRVSRFRARVRAGTSPRTFN